MLCRPFPGTRSVSVGCAASPVRLENGPRASFLDLKQPETMHFTMDFKLFRH